MKRFDETVQSLKRLKTVEDCAELETLEIKAPLVINRDNNQRCFYSDFVVVCELSSRWEVWPIYLRVCRVRAPLRRVIQKKG